ncbi:MAG: ECF transporter S component [Anaerorhabdus sp.]
MTKNNKVRKMTQIAILSVIAFLLMSFSFPIPIAPSFYKLDFSEVAVLVGGFSMGPIAAIAIEALKILFEIIFRSTTTGYVGEFANFLMGCALVVPAAYYYKKNKSFKGAVIGLVIGCVSMIIIAAVLNYFVILPMYANMGFPMEKIIEAGTAIIPIIKNKFTFVLLATTPFNILKSVSVSLITVVLYKRISPLLK